jgi:hypothetical protein
MPVGEVADEQRVGLRIEDLDGPGLQCHAAEARQSYSMPGTEPICAPK